MEIGTTPQEDRSPDLQLGSHHGRTSIGVQGSDITPRDTAGWTTVSKRVKHADAANASKAGESPATEHTSRARERASYARRATAAATKAARMPSILPKDDIKIIVRPRGGLNIARTEATIIMSAVVAAAGIPKQEANADTICTNVAQNIIVVSTPDPHRAGLYVSMQGLFIGGRNYEVSAYQAAHEDTVKGVIRGIAVEDSPTEVNANIVNEANPLALQAHRIGNTTAVIILFEGPKVPNYVKYGPILLRCSLYRKHFDVCRKCGKVGHRSDVCPFPDTRVCIACGAANPNADHDRHCTPKCKLCGGRHVTGARECTNKFKMPYVVKRRQWSRKMDALGSQRFPECNSAVDFPPLRSEPPEGTRGRSQTRGNSRRRSNSRRSTSRVRQPSVTRERVAWADALKTSKTPVRPSPATDTAMKALQNENAQLRQKIADLERMNADINMKLDRLLTLQQQAPSERHPSPTGNQPPAEAATAEARPEQDPRIQQREAEPTPKRRALEAAKERKLLVRLENLEERTDAFIKMSNDRSAKLEQTCGNMQTMMMQMQTQLQILMSHLGLGGDPQQFPPVNQQPTPGHFPQ